MVITPAAETVPEAAAPTQQAAPETPPAQDEMSVAEEKYEYGGEAIVIQ